MGAKEKLFRQKLANQIEKLLTKSEVVFGAEKLTNEWLEEMLDESQELITRLTIFKFLHELPEDADLQVQFLEMADEENELAQEQEIPSYGDEILKEIDEFESSEAIDVEVAPETFVADPEPVVAEKPEPVVEEVVVTPPAVDEQPIAQSAPEVEEVAEEKEQTIEAVDAPDPVVAETPETTPVEVVPEPVVEVAEEVVAPIVEEIKEELVEEEVIEEIIDEAPEPVVEEVSEPEVVVTESEEDTSEPEEVSETVEEEKVKEINDVVASSEPSLADKLSSKSIKKLAETIALNERFLYSNELFNGNMEAFKRALNELDHVASLEDAKRYIAVQLKEENNWNMESETVQNFISLVERRFV